MRRQEIAILLSHTKIIAKSVVFFDEIESMLWHRLINYSPFRSHTHLVIARSYFRVIFLLLLKGGDEKSKRKKRRLLMKELKNKILSIM